MPTSFSPTGPSGPSCSSSRDVRVSTPNLDPLPSLIMTDFGFLIYDTYFSHLLGMLEAIAKEFLQCDSDHFLVLANEAPGTVRLIFGMY